MQRLAVARRLDGVRWNRLRTTVELARSMGWLAHPGQSVVAMN